MVPSQILTKFGFFNGFGTFGSIAIRKLGFPKKISKTRAIDYQWEQHSKSSIFFKLEILPLLSLIHI